MGHYCGVDQTLALQLGGGRECICMPCFSCSLPSCILGIHIVLLVLPNKVGIWEPLGKHLINKGSFCLLILLFYQFCLIILNHKQDHE